MRITRQPDTSSDYWTVKTIRERRELLPGAFLDVPHAAKVLAARYAERYTIPPKPDTRSDDMR